MFTANATGTESIYTVYEGHEIMFHVSTLLPHSLENKQQVSCLKKGGFFLKKKIKKKRKDAFFVMLYKHLT